MKPGVFREEYIAIIVRELLRGLDYLHTEGKLHRDIKGTSICVILMYHPSHSLYSCEHLAICWRGSKTGGFRRIWAAFRHPFGEEEYIRWNTLLDVPRGHQTKRL